MRIDRKLSARSRWDPKKWFFSTSPGFKVPKLGRPFAKRSRISTSHFSTTYHIKSRNFRLKIILTNVWRRSDANTHEFMELYNILLIRTKGALHGNLIKHQRFTSSRNYLQKTNAIEITRWGGGGGRKETIFPDKSSTAIHHAVNSHAGQHCKPRWR